MNNYSMALGLEQKQLDSAGSAMERYGEFEKSTEAKINDFINALQKMYMTLTNSDTINKVIEGLTKFITIIDNSIKYFGSFEIAIYTVIAALTLFKGKAIAGAIIGLAEYIIAFGLAEVATYGLGVALGFLTAPLTILVTVIGAVTFGLISYANAQQKLKEQTEASNKAQSEFNKTLDEFNKTADPSKIDALAKSLENLKKAVNYDESVKRIEELKKAIAEMGNNPNKYSQFSYESAIKELKQLEDAIQPVINEEKILTEQQKLGIAMDYKSAESKAKNAALAIQQANGNIKLVESYKLVYNKLKMGIALTEEETNLNNQLLDQYPQYSKMLNDKTKAIGLNFDALEKNLTLQQALAIAEFTSLQQSMRLEIQSTNIKLTETNNRIDIINSEIEAYEKLNKAKASVLTSKTLDPIGKEIAKRMPTFNTKDLGQELIGQGKIKEQLEFAKAAKEVIVNASPADILKSISSSGYIPPNTKKKKEKKPGEVSAKEIADAKIKEINYEVDLDKKKEKTLETQIKMAKEAKDYNKQIELTNQLITTQKKTVTDLNTANKKLHTEADNVRDKSKYKDTEKWFNIAGEESSYYIEKFNKASKSEQESMQKTFTLLQKLKNAYKSNSDEINQYSDALTSTKQSLEDVYKSQKKAYEEWHDKTKEVADKVVDLIKDAYEKQKDLAVAAIEKQMEAEEKRHDKEISNIEETLKKREDATDAQLKLLDKQDDEEEYNKKLTKAQKERQEKLDKISILSMDNSFEAQGQVIDLQKEIAEKDEEIAEIKNDRNKKLRKENLKDELDSYKTEIDKKKKAEDDKYKATKDSLDKQKKDQDLYYTNLINNEVYFQELRTDILNKGTDKAKAKLNEFLNDFKSKNESTVTAIGQSWNSLLSIRQNLEKSITSLDNVNYKPKTDWENGVSNPLGMSNADFATYVGNKGAWESGVNQSTTSSSNQALREKYGITNDRYSFNDLKEYLPEYDTGGYTGNNDSFPALLHKKELILNQVDTGNILKTVDIVRNIVDKINLSGINLKPVVGGNNGSGNGSVVNISSINLNIDKLNGNEQGGKIAFNTIIKELSKQGVRMPSSTY